MHRQPALIKILTTDYAAAAGALFPVVSWLMYLAFIIFGEASPSDLMLPAIFGAITVVALGVLFWRIRLFNTIFSDGVEVRATISNVFFFRDRGRVDYIYTHNGQKYTSGNAVMKTKRTKALQVGDEVIVMIDSSNPKRAYLRDLYL